MQTIFTYLSEKRVQDFLPSRYGRGILLEDQEDALLSTFTEAQKALWDQWRGTQETCDQLYQQALFQAAWAAARELA